jgi:hypothetical protein
MNGLSNQYPEKHELSEDERIQKELSDLKAMFPQKRFQIIGESGSQRIEVMLNW